MKMDKLYLNNCSMDLNKIILVQNMLMVRFILTSTTTIKKGTKERKKWLAIKKKSQDISIKVRSEATTLMRIKRNMSYKMKRTMAIF